MLNYFSFIRFLFFIELLVAGAFFARFLHRRKKFALRCVSGFFVCTAYAVFFPITDHPFYTIFMYLSIFALFVGYLVFCFEEKFSTLIFVGVSAYTAQKVSSMVNSLISLIDVDLFFHTNVWNTWWFLMYIACFAAVYFLFWLLFVRKVKEYGESIQIKRNTLLVITVAAMIINTVIGWMNTYYITGDAILQMYDYIWNLISCILLLLLEIYVLEKNSVEYRLNIMQEFYRKQEEQYRFSKANVDAINRKCHDIKYILRANAAGSSGTAIEEVMDLVSIYDNALKTGNATLDLILSEKSVYCNQYNIIITCLADGSLLNFITDVDLYVMCGNLLDNAIRGVKDLSDIGRRNIYITVKSTGAFVTFNIENDYDGNVVLKNGMPVTSKADSENHGYGLQSVKMIVEKYDGGFSLDCDGGVFKVNLIFPLKRDAA